MFLVKFYEYYLSQGGTMCYNNQYDINNRCGGRGFDYGFDPNNCNRGYGRRQSYICFPTGNYWNYGWGRSCGCEPYGPYYNGRMNFNNYDNMSRCNNYSFNPFTNVVFANCYSGYGWCGRCNYCNCRGRLYGGEGRNNNCGC